MTSDYHDIRIGQMVRTVRNALTAEQEQRNYQPGMRRCIWGIDGTVLDVSDAHGLCFQVQHPLGQGSAWYERREIMPLEHE